MLSLENHPAAIRSADLNTVRLPYAAVRGEVNSLGTGHLNSDLNLIWNYSFSKGKTVTSAYAPGELQGVIQKVVVIRFKVTTYLTNSVQGGVHWAQEKYEPDGVLGWLAEGDALLHQRGPVLPHPHQHHPLPPTLLPSAQGGGDWLEWCSQSWPGYW